MTAITYHAGWKLILPPTKLHYSNKNFAILNRRNNELIYEHKETMLFLNLAICENKFLYLMRQNISSTFKNYYGNNNGRKYDMTWWKLLSNLEDILYGIFTNSRSSRAFYSYRQFPNYLLMAEYASIIYLYIYEY